MDFSFIFDSQYFCYWVIDFVSRTDEFFFSLVEVYKYNAPLHILFYSFYLYLIDGNVKSLFLLIVLFANRRKRTACACFDVG